MPASPPGQPNGLVELGLVAGSPVGDPLLESVPDAVVGVDGDGRIALANSHVERLFGYGQRELVGEPIKQLVPEGLPRPRAGAVLLHGAPDLHARRKDGSVFPAEISVGPLQTATGLLVAAVIRDVTERKQIEEELRRTKAQLTEAQSLARIGSWEWDVASGRVVWSDELYELLLRLEDDDGLVLPGAFLAMAERLGLIHAIDQWVVRKSIALLAEHAAAGRRLKFEVNLSGRSVGDHELTALIAREVTAAQIDPASLIFEITETAAIANMDEARGFASKLTAAGCSFALDDFGTGFGSFYYLKHLPADYLKIDGDFVGSPRSRTDELIVEAIVQVARGLGKRTIAEYVTDAETVERMRSLGVDYAQGYHVGHPFPVAELPARLAGTIGAGV